MKITREKEILVYENDYVQVYDDEVKFPTGNKGTYFRTKWKAPYGVAIVPTDGERAILIRSFRYTENHVVTEVPQGFGTVSSSPEKDAERELFEETGLIGGNLSHIATFGKEFVTYLFLCDISSKEKPSRKNQEDTESIIEFVEISLDDLSFDQLTRAGITDPLTVAALFLARDHGQSSLSQSV